MLSYTDICWQYLNKFGSITAKAINILTGTTTPHSVIRSIKKRYGENILTFEDVKKVKKYIENGKEKSETKTYRVWYLQKMEG